MKIAVLGFFIAGVAGVAMDVPMFTCAQRALAAAFVLYVLASIVTRYVFSIIVDAAVRERTAQGEQRNADRGN